MIQVFCSFWLQLCSSISSFPCRILFCISFFFSSPLSRIYLLSFYSSISIFFYFYSTDSSTPNIYDIISGLDPFSRILLLHFWCLADCRNSSMLLLLPLLRFKADPNTISNTNPKFTIDSGFSSRATLFTRSSQIFGCEKKSSITLQKGLSKSNLVSRRKGEDKGKLKFCIWWISLG